MPVTQLPPERTWGSSIGQAFMNYMRGKQMKRQQGMEEQQFGIESALKQAQTQKATAEAGQSESMQNVLQGLLRGKEGGIGGLGLEDYDVSIGPGGPTFQPIKLPSPTERTDIATGRASLDALDNLKVLFDSTQTKTGPVIGRMAPTKGLFGLTTDEQEAFMAATSAFKNAIIKEITGAQMSEVEAKRIMKQVPDITDPPTRWQAKWIQSKKNLEFLQQRRLEVLGQSGMRVPTGVQGVTTTPQKPTQQIFTATNPTTGEKVQSTDGGKTWQPIQ